MGIQTLVLFAGVAVALAVGIITAAWGLRVVGWISIGLIPVTWAAIKLLERSLGREIWRYSKPYRDHA
jgi:hypothetical protein